MHLHINTYGTYVHVKEELFDIRFKNKEGVVEHKQYAAAKVTGIVLTTGCALSTDAVRLAMRNNVDILFVEHSGDPIGRVWHSKLGSTTRIRKEQLVTSLGPSGVTWVKKWLLTKIDNQLTLVKDLKKHRPQHALFLDDKASRMEALSVSIGTLEAGRVADIADTLRGLEGTAGRLYFETLSYVLPTDYRFSGRSSRPAKDAFNAMLNYAYGMLYGQVEKCLIVAGVDPYVGFMHRDDYNQLSMVYDFIEPYRIFADETVFRLFTAKKVAKAHVEEFVNRQGGVGVSLNKEGKALLVTAFNAFMDADPIRYNGRNLTRNHCIQLDAHQFAQKLIGESSAGGNPLANINI